MIIKPPTNKFEVNVYNYILNNKFNGITSEGERSILYDLCILIQKRLNEEITDIQHYVDTIAKVYNKNKNVTMNIVISNCINRLNTNIKAKVEKDMFGGNERLVIDIKKGK